MRSQTLYACAPVDFYKDAVIDIDALGSPRVGAAAVRLTSIADLPAGARTVDLAFRDHLMIYHYFHFMELLLSAFAVMSEFMPGFVVDRIYVGNQSWDNARQNHVQRKLLEHVLAPRRIVEGDPGADPGAKRSDLLCLVDRFYPQHCHFNKFLEGTMTLCRRHTPAFRHRVLRSLGIAERSAAAAEAASALYVTREPPRTLVAEADSLLEDGFRWNDLRLNRVDFATLSWEDQVRRAHEADWLVGVHGNGLTNMIWMPEGGRVLELFPAGSHHYDYQFYAEICRLRYVGLEGCEEPAFVFTNGSRNGPAYGNANQPVSTLPAAWLGDNIAALI